MYLVEYAKAIGKGFEIVCSEYFDTFEEAKESAENWEHTYYAIWRLESESDDYSFVTSDDIDVNCVSVQ